MSPGLNRRVENSDLWPVVESSRTSAKLMRWRILKGNSSVEFIVVMFEYAAHAFAVLSGEWKSGVLA